MPIHRGPGRERDPDPIERMYRAYINSDVVGPEAMLAAVRELYAISLAPGHAQGTFMTQNWLSDRITDHERRSDGKRQ